MRIKCQQKGCNNLATLTGRRVDGSRVYKKLCHRHHREKYSMRDTSGKHSRINGYTKRSCKRCGWNESYCDVHRVVRGKDGGKYVPDNVIVLCPNCHRVEHYNTV